MSSPWNHPICELCWKKRCAEAGEPDRVPYRIKGEFLTAERCCFCGTIMKSRIYVREDPGTMACHGKHEEVTGKEESAIDIVPRIGEDISTLSMELARDLIGRMTAFRNGALEKTGDHNIANNASIRAAAIALGTSMALVALSAKGSGKLDEFFASIDADLDEAISVIMSKHMGPGGSVVTLSVEVPKKPKKKEGGP